MMESTAQPPKIEGWMLKKGAKGLGANSFKKRWFSISPDNRLHYYQNKGESNSLGFIDIMAASSIAPSGKKAGEFQIITPGRTYTLQAASDQAMNEWLGGLNTYRRHIIRKSRGIDALDDQDATNSSNNTNSNSNSNSNNLHRDRRSSVSVLDSRALKNQGAYATIGASAPANRSNVSAHTGVAQLFATNSSGNVPTASPPTSPGRPVSHYAPLSIVRDVGMDNEEIKRLQAALAQAEKEVEQKNKQLQQVKTVMSEELKQLQTKQQITLEEIDKLREEFSLSQKVIAELKRKEDQQKRDEPSSASSASSASSQTTCTGGEKEELKRLREECVEKDAKIEEQRQRIEMLRTKLEQRIEEEASEMKARVRETMERLRKEHEDQLKKARDGT